MQLTNYQECRQLPARPSSDISTTNISTTNDQYHRSLLKDIATAHDQLLAAHFRKMLGSCSQEQVTTFTTLGMECTHFSWKERHHWS